MGFDRDDEIEVDDVGAVDPHETAGIEPGLQVLEARVDQVLPPAGVELHVVVARLETLDGVQGDRDHPSPLPDEHARDGAGGPERFVRPRDDGGMPSLGVLT
jgi:hypothetical protein